MWSPVAHEEDEVGMVGLVYFCMNGSLLVMKKYLNLLQSIRVDYGYVMSYVIIFFKKSNLHPRTTTKVQFLTFNNKTAG